MFSNQIYIQNSLTELNQLVVLRFIELAQQSIADHGSFHVALSGGATPRSLYRLMASETYNGLIQWNYIYLYQTDERLVPFDHPDNNFFMIQSQLLDGLSWSNIQFYRIDTRLKTADGIARAYEHTLFENLPKNNAGHPQFDFILLGLGTDGHVASLFPETDALSVLDRYVAHVFLPHLNAWRVSLTLMTLNQARQVAVLIAGESKAIVVENLFCDPPTINYPAHQLKTIQPIEWYIDSEAASRLLLCS